MSHQQALGIDLGTSNCALARVGAGELEVLDIPQLEGPNRVGEAPLFAAVLYIPREGQFASDSLRLPWSETEERVVVGNFARAIGAQVPDRVITSPNHGSAGAGPIRLARSCRGARGSCARNSHRSRRAVRIWNTCEQLSCTLRTYAKRSPNRHRHGPY
jgi:molecular chaperone DnaK (HSP70)